jgi:hypothetical protein
MQRYLTEVLPADSSVAVGKSFPKFAKQHGWASFEKPISNVMKATEAGTLARNAELLRTLCMGRDKNPERLELCREWCSQLIVALIVLDGEPPQPDWRIQKVDRQELLCWLVEAMLAVDAQQQLSQLIDHTLTNDRYDLTDAHLAAIFSLQTRLSKLTGENPPISQWLAACRIELESRTAQPPPEPTDYTRDSEISCTCSDCRALSKFLADPARQEARFPMAKQRRQHLHNTIDRNRLDCTHVTHRSGRPYSLVCTKTTDSYQAACKIHQRDQDNLSRLHALEKKIC